MGRVPFECPKLLLTTYQLEIILCSEWSADAVYKYSSIHCWVSTLSQFLHWRLQAIEFEVEHMRDAHLCYTVHGLGIKKNNNLWQWGDKKLWSELSSTFQKYFCIYTLHVLCYSRSCTSGRIFLSVSTW